MKPFNVEIFDRFIEFRSAGQFTETEVKEDYISPEKCKIKTKRSGIIHAEVGDFVHITGPGVDNWGVVSAYETSADETTLTYQGLLSMLDFDIPYINRGAESLETYLATAINWFFHTYAPVDADPPLPDRLVTTLTETSGDWQAITDKGERPKDLNVIDDIMRPLFDRYNIVVRAYASPMDKVVHFDIGKITSEGFVIEADLPNVFDRKIRDNIKTSELNALILWNEDYGHVRRRYLLEDGTITDDPHADGRISPMVYDVYIHSVPEGMTEAEACDEVAKGILTRAVHEHLIELEVAADDALVTPERLQIGQTVRILSGGKWYSSILSGRSVSADRHRLIFGTVRVELTKILGRI